MYKFDWGLRCQAGALTIFALIFAGLAWSHPLSADTGQSEARTRPGDAAAGQSNALLARSYLPKVLSPHDAELYRSIFLLQEDGKWAKADKLIKQLQDPRLMGHILEQRYMHPTAYRSRFRELRDWLSRYADHPDASRIYRLALKRRPQNAAKPRKPVTNWLSSGGAKRYSYRSSKRRSEAERRKVSRIKRQIQRNVRYTRLTITEQLLASEQTRKLLDQAEIDWGYAEVASGWFYYGKPEQAFLLADQAGRRSGEAVPFAHWIAGLSAWRLNRIEDAAWHFEALAHAENASDWLVAGGAYWASRAQLKLKRPEKVSGLLRLAAGKPRTFYGLIAASALGLESNLDFSRPRIDKQMLARLEGRPVTQRALALLQVGQHERARRELLQFGRLKNVEEAEALLMLAEQAGFPDLAFKIGSWLAGEEETGGPLQAVDAALYPIPPWQPTGGFALDRALIYGLMRQESAFNPSAKSHAGARGLMQLMPNTANYIAPGKGYHKHSRRDVLFDPTLNITLGQRYITYLLSQDGVNGDLFRLATAYNGGPGNLARWERKVQAQDDPLYFIESLPSWETRLFIERVLANFWIYRQRLGQDSPSLDQVASGSWPLYHPLDVPHAEVAENGAN